MMTVDFILHVLIQLDAGCSPVSVSLSVCLSQVGVLLKRLNESSWFLALGLPSTYPLPCFRVLSTFGLSKNKVLFLGSSSQTSNLKSFALACQLSKRVINVA